MGDVIQLNTKQLHHVAWALVLGTSYRLLFQRHMRIEKATWLKLAEAVPEPEDMCGNKRHMVRGRDHGKCAGCAFVEWVQPQLPFAEHSPEYDLAMARAKAAVELPAKELCGTFVRAIDAARYGAHTDMQDAMRAGAAMAAKRRAEIEGEGDVGIIEVVGEGGRAARRQQEGAGGRSDGSSDVGGG